MWKEERGGGANLMEERERVDKKGKRRVGR